MLSKCLVLIVNGVPSQKDLDPADTSVQRISRGALPTGFFTSTTSAMEYLQASG